MKLVREEINPYRKGVIIQIFKCKCGYLYYNPIEKEMK